MAITNQSIKTSGFNLSILNQAQGDVLYFDGTSWVRLAKDVGKYLKSGAAAVSWDTPPTGSGSWTLQATKTFSAEANYVFSGLPSKKLWLLLIFVENVAAANDTLSLRLNADAGNDYAYAGMANGALDSGSGQASAYLCGMAQNNTAIGQVIIGGQKNTNGAIGISNDVTAKGNAGLVKYFMSSWEKAGETAISSIEIRSQSGNLSLTGKAALYYANDL